MAQPVIQDNFEKPSSAKAPAGKQVSSISQSTLPPRTLPRPAFAKAPAGNAGLDWLEQGFGQRRVGDDAAKKTKEAQEEKNQKDQLTKLKELDNRRSKQMYEEIQQAIQLIRKKKKFEPEKYVTAAAGYDPQQHRDPETFWQKVKKKQEAAKNKLLPWTSKQGMGTGEITRGVSG